MRFAQILYNKAYWIFEADKQPDFSPDIILVDITEKPEVREGWDYDENTGIFSQYAVETLPIEPTQEDYLLDLDYRLSKIELGVWQYDIHIL